MNKKRTLLIESNLFRSENAAGTVEFPGAMVTSNKRFMDFLDKAQNDFNIVFITDDITKERQRLSTCNLPLFRKTLFKNWNDLNEYILVGFDISSDDIDDFLQFTEVGGSTVVSVDTNGLVGGTSFTEIATLEGNTGEVVQTLYDNGDIIV